MVLKRILGALVHRRPEVDGHADGPDHEPASDAQFIRTCDTFGREIRIRRTAWRANVLLPSLDKAWNDPEQLYARLVAALDDGFADDLDAASTRLLAIDPSPDRALALRSIVLMETGRHAESGQLLLAGIDAAQRHARDASGLKQTGTAEGAQSAAPAPD